MQTCNFPATGRGGNMSPDHAIPYRAFAGLLAVLVISLACNSGSSGSSGGKDLFTYYLTELDAYFYVPYATENPGDIGGGGFVYEFDMTKTATQVVGGASTPDGAPQSTNTYIHYVGDTAGDATQTCIGDLDAEFTYGGTRYVLTGLVTRGFKNPKELSIPDANPYATGSFTISPNPGPDGTVSFWPYEFDPTSPISQTYFLEPR